MWSIFSVIKFQTLYEPSRQNVIRTFSRHYTDSFTILKKSYTEEIQDDSLSLGSIETVIQVSSSSDNATNACATA